MKIGERIRNLRQLSNLTQEELAERANLTKGFISQIEHDLTSISLDSLIQILEALDENISDFFREASQEKIIYQEKDRVAIEKEKIEKFVKDSWSDQLNIHFAIVDDDKYVGTVSLKNINY